MVKVTVISTQEWRICFFSISFMSSPYVLQKDGAQHTNKSETHLASMKCAANPLFIPCGRAGDTGWAMAVGTERSQVPASGWGAAPVPGGPQKCRASDTSHGSELSQLSTCKPFFLAFTMRYLPTHLWVPSRFNPNRPGMFWFCLFFMSSAVMKLFLGLSSLFTVFFFIIFFFVFFMQENK